MNKIQWNLPSSFGSSFKLNITKTNKLFNHNSIKLMRQFSQPNSLNTTVLNNSRSELILLKNQIISFALSKICFKDIGYFLKLGLPMTSFSFKYQNIKIILIHLISPIFNLRFYLQTIHYFYFLHFYQIN
jgi:hypothetical protein